MHKLSLRLVLPVVALCIPLGCASHTAEPLTIRWTHPSGDEREFDALIQRPTNPNGTRIMLVGGGSVTPIDWRLPGGFTDPNSGQTFQLTIDGKDTRDAQRIANRLLDEGYTIWRWSSIYRGDPLHAQDPAMSEYQIFPYTVEMTRSALNAFAARDPLNDAPLYLLGHSLGAARSIIVGAQDPRVTGFVFLAGAYLSNTGKPSDASLVPLRESNLDTDGDDILTGDEAPGLFPAFDRDRDGIIRAWEYTGTRVARMGGWPDSGETMQVNQGGIPFETTWPADALIMSRKPALAIFGGLDPMSTHGPILNARAHRNGAPIEVVYFADLGHQLSIEQDDKATDIDDKALDAIVRWLDQHSH